MKEIFIVQGKVGYEGYEIVGVYDNVSMAEDRKHALEGKEDPRWDGFKVRSFSINDDCIESEMVT